MRKGLSVLAAESAACGSFETTGSGGSSPSEDGLVLSQNWSSKGERSCAAEDREDKGLKTSAVYVSAMGFTEW